MLVNITVAPYWNRGQSPTITMSHDPDFAAIYIEPVQRNLGLVVDGDDGPKTWRSINLAVGSEPASPVPATPGGSSGVPAGDPFTGILDLNHDNSLDLGAFLGAGFAAIIHKATEGTGFRDPKYAARKSAAMSAGILWGAYHFTRGGDGREQCDAFLEMEDFSNPKILGALDFEPSPGPDMTIEQGRAFILRFHEKTGRYPVVYGGGGLLRDLLEGKNDPVFGACPLWLADYRHAPKVIAPTWSRWTLLQYTDGATGQEPRATPGSDGADRNSFAGTLEDLRAEWPFA